MSDMVLREVRLVPLDGAPTRREASAEPLDVLVRDGVIDQVGRHLDVPAELPVLPGQGRWAIPGLWDQHVHMAQWGLTMTRLDVSGAAGPGDVVAAVGAHLGHRGAGTATGVLTGWGYRSATWRELPTVAALDAVSGSTPVVLVSGDGHNGWLNTAALQLFGAADRPGPLVENEWFEIYTRLGDLPGSERETELGVALAVSRARAKGVVGIVDLELARPWLQWPGRYAAGLGPFRVRTGVYPDRLDEVIGVGLATGDPISGTDGLVRMGPLKIISDGSLNTRTAWCCEPYADGAELEDAAGSPNLPADQVHQLVGRAHQHGLQSALHAIGDRAVAVALQAFAATGAAGSIEHAQLLPLGVLSRWAGLPVRASVQPAHLLDDRVVTEQCWPDRTARSFALRHLLDHGITLALGSDAPVAPLDPWLAMAAAVHRGPAGAQAWHPEQALTPLEALRASVDGRRIAPGEPGDMVLLDHDPLAGGTPAEQADRLRSMTVGATVIAGRTEWSADG